MRDTGRNSLGTRIGVNMGASPMTTIGYYMLSIKRKKVNNFVGEGV